jgi:hypothetical protein
MAPLLVVDDPVTLLGILTVEVAAVGNVPLVPLVQGSVRVYPFGLTPAAQDAVK